MTVIDDLERAIEAMLFASDQALDARQVAARFGDEMTPGAVRAIIQRLAARHAGSGLELAERCRHWHFQTPADLEIGRANVCTPVTNAQLVCRILNAQHKKN